jgi:CheY-like chemotaxis protein
LSIITHKDCALTSIPFRSPNIHIAPVGINAEETQDVMDLLIVEDNDQMRRMIVKLVHGLAEHTYECSDGAEALPAYTMHRPDWVLMDVKMKEMDGISATRQIKASYPKANIMIVTDYDDPDLREAARKAGACEFVTKENLFDVRRILSLPKNRAAP